MATAPIVGSGSVITKDVPDDADGVERSPQNNREGRREALPRDEDAAKKPKDS